MVENTFQNKILFLLKTPLFSVYCREVKSPIYKNAYLKGYYSSIITCGKKFSNKVNVF